MLCCLSKVFERALLNRVSPMLSLSDHQHGFRANRSTATYLTTLTQKIAEGFNQASPPSRAVLATIDISKAFDTVPRHLLMSKILALDLPPNDIRLLTNFISRRSGRVLLRNYKSRFRSFPNGSLRELSFPHPSSTCSSMIFLPPQMM